MKSTIFDKIYYDYLAQIADIDLNQVEKTLGIKINNNNEAAIRFFNSLYRVSPDGIKNSFGERPSHAISVVLCKYLLTCRDNESEEKQWVTYKDFKDASPFVSGFINNSEKPIADKFSGRLMALENAGRKLGGYSPEQTFPYDLSMQFNSLPKIPVLLLFNDRDDEFPAKATLLFEKRAEKYLDMECLAIIGWTLHEFLVDTAGNSGGTLI